MGVGDHAQGGRGVAEHRDVTSAIGAQHGAAEGAQVVHRASRRMAIGVIGADRHQRQARVQRAGQLPVLVGRAVVRHLEDVDRPRADPAQQLGLGGRFEVAEQREAQLPRGDQECDAGVVRPGRLGAEPTGRPQHVPGQLGTGAAVLPRRGSQHRHLGLGRPAGDLGHLALRCVDGGRLDRPDRPVAQHAR